MREGITQSIIYKDQYYGLTGLEYCELEDMLEREPDTPTEHVIYRYLTSKGYFVPPPSPVEIQKPVENPVMNTTREEQWTQEKLLREKEKLLREKEKLLNAREQGNEQRKEQRSEKSLLVNKDGSRWGVMDYVVLIIGIMIVAFLVMVYEGAKSFHENKIQEIKQKR